jgi:hypothetical protein
MNTIGECKETAQELKDKHGVDYDIPASVVCKETTLDATLDDAIRVYPQAEDVDYDLPNQIQWDLKDTWTWRAVALHNPDGEAVEWYGYNGATGEYWPEYYDDPVWKRHSVYAFIKHWDEENEYTYALHYWPLDMDPNAEVVG